MALLIRKRRMNIWRDTGLSCREKKMRVCYCEDETAQAKLFKNQVDKWAVYNKANVCMDI